MTTQTDWRDRNIDVHPADVRITTGDTSTLYQRARVRTNQTYIEVWVEQALYPHQPMLVFTAPIIDIIESTLNPRYPRKRQYVELTVEIGLISADIHVQALPGCGCGSRLKQLPPTQHEINNRTPIEQTLAAHFPMMNHPVPQAQNHPATQQVTAGYQ
jgi:hypothetical protein